MLKISHAGCFGLSPTISSQFTIEMCAAAKNCKKITKTPLLEVQGRSRSSLLTNLKTMSPVLVMICSKSVTAMCNHFHTEPIMTNWRIF